MLSLEGATSTSVHYIKDYIAIRAYHRFIITYFSSYFTTSYSYIHKHSQPELLYNQHIITV